MDQTVVAAIQLSSQADVGVNLDRAATLVAEAAQRGAELVLLPENFAFLGGGEEERRAVAEDLDPVGIGGAPAAFHGPRAAPLLAAPAAFRAPIARRLSELARAHGIWLIGGGMPERSGDRDRPYNTCAVFAPD